MKTILVVDDKVSLRTLVKSYLTQSGFNVVEASNGREALFVARETRPDLILLDIMMPELDGFGFMQQFKKQDDTPIIMITAKVEESDAVLGLELGADDYITKPFGMREMLARVRAVLRRFEKAAAPSDRLEQGELTLDRDSRRVTVAGRPIELTPSEFELLDLFMSSPGRVYSRSDLLDTLSGDDGAILERTVDVHIRNLRRKVEPNSRRPRYIETVYGVGYRFSAEIE